MSALPDWSDVADAQDAREQSSVDATAQFELDCLEEMRGDVRFVREFIEDEGPDDACLLSMLIDRGLPLKDSSQRDDRYCELLDEQIEKFREAFDAWALTSQFRAASPLARYIGLVRDQR